MSRYHDLVRQGQALTGAAPHFLGGEELLEDAVADCFGDSAAIPPSKKR
jgi:hypothetical protein